MLTSIRVGIYIIRITDGIFLKNDEYKLKRFIANCHDTNNNTVKVNEYFSELYLCIVNLYFFAVGRSKKFSTASFVDLLYKPYLIMEGEKSIEAIM